ncbi:unnamed protein product, partial [Brachionus calyciflorus]
NWFMNSRRNYRVTKKNEFEISKESTFYDSDHAGLLIKFEAPIDPLNFEGIIATEEEMDFKLDKMSRKLETSIFDQKDNKCSRFTVLEKNPKIEKQDYVELSLEGSKQGLDEKNEFPPKENVDEKIQDYVKEENEINFFDRIFNENLIYSESLIRNKSLTDNEEKISSEIKVEVETLTFDLKNAEKKIADLLIQLKEKEDLIYTFSEENNEKIEELNGEIFKNEKSLGEKNRLIENLKHELHQKNVEIESHLAKSCEINEINKNIKNLKSKSC